MINSIVYRCNKVFKESVLSFHSNKNFKNPILKFGRNFFRKFFRINRTTHMMYNKYNINNNRLFILGAGFSAHAGIPLMDTLLKLTMDKFKKESDVSERIDHYVRIYKNLKDGEEIDYLKIDFSELCDFLEFIELREYGAGERYKDYGSREKISLRYYLAKTIAENTPLNDKIPELYIKFAKQLHDKDIVLSFNWDLLLEAALIKIGKKYTYNFAEEGCINLAKLHGSINWRIERPYSDNDLDWQPLHPEYDREKLEIYKSDTLIDYTLWEKDTSSIEPFLVLPGYGKAFDVRFNALHWYKIENIFNFTKDIYIIGLSLAQDDFFIKNLFLYTLQYLSGFASLHDGEKELFIINPDDKINENYSFISEYKHTHIIKEKFKLKHIEDMKHRLK